ncbi:hypothetical protein Q3G72_011925 [Acer saccharum]|nr:hypothetical protein Q3G72_011925 [Acer saccharum]
MNDDDVLPTNIVDSSSSKGDEAVGSGSLEVAPLKGNVKPLALGGKVNLITLTMLQTCRWRTVSSQAAALHAVACGSVVITMLDKPTVHDVEV